MKDDEDKGSPPQDGANLALTPALSQWERDVRRTGERQEKIDSSAEALRVYQHPLYLSLRKSILQ